MIEIKVLLARSCDRNTFFRKPFIGGIIHSRILKYGTLEENAHIYPSIPCINQGLYDGGMGKNVHIKPHSSIGISNFPDNLSIESIIRTHKHLMINGRNVSTILKTL